MYQKLSKSLKIAIFSAVAYAAPMGWAETSLGKTPSNVPVSEVKWLPTPIGPMVSPVQGDFAQGAHITYLKFQPGTKTPLHTHSTDYVGIVLSGRMRHEAKGVPVTERVLGAGSHWFMPGTVEHVSECLKGAECVLVLVQNEKFDFLPVEKQK